MDGDGQGRCWRWRTGSLHFPGRSDGNTEGRLHLAEAAPDLRTAADAVPVGLTDYRALMEKRSSSPSSFSYTPRARSAPPAASAASGLGRGGSPGIFFRMGKKIGQERVRVVLMLHTPDCLYKNWISV